MARIVEVKNQKTITLELSEEEASHLLGIVGMVAGPEPRLIRGIFEALEDAEVTETEYTTVNGTIWPAKERQ